MDLILRKVRENDIIFGGVLIIANGDTNQLPNIDGTEIFLSTTLPFVFHVHFLTTLVRMLDPIGQQLLNLMTQRPVPETDIDIIVKVFGRKDNEHEAIERHQESRISSGVAFVEYSVDDEICNENSTQWVPACDDVVKYLNKECREPQKVVLTLESVVRLTVNSDNFSQGQV